MKLMFFATLATLATFALMAGATYGAIYAVSQEDPLQMALGAVAFLFCLGTLLYGAAQV